jgi:hypothetical protein
MELFQWYKALPIVLLRETAMRKVPARECSYQDNYTLAACAGSSVRCIAYVLKSTQTYIAHLNTRKTLTAAVACAQRRARVASAMMRAYCSISYTHASM